MIADKRALLVVAAKPTAIQHEAVRRRRFLICRPFDDLQRSPRKTVTYTSASSKESP